MSVLKLEGLNVRFGSQEAVHDLSLTLQAGKMLALVGESGSGKSLTALSLLDLLPHGAERRIKSLTLNDENLLAYSDAQLRSLRGGRIGMIFQEPLTALNPLHNVEKQISECLFIHQGLSKRAAKARCLTLLEQVELPATQDMLERYPHQLSGGQRQRVMIAMALANEPDILIADEPTTALDVTVQETILALLKRFQKELNLSILLISHDLGVVSRYADDIIVMHQGKVVEAGTTQDVLHHPSDTYTQHLLDSEPSGTATALSSDAPLLISAQDIDVQFKRARQRLFHKTEPFHAVDHVNLEIKQGETLGIVGESGSGKSTLAMALLRLLPATGRTLMAKTDLMSLSQRELRPWRQRIQVVFQDPYGSLNPRMTVGQILAEGLHVHAPTLPVHERQARVANLLVEVGLSAESQHRYPHEFSGGQRQRIAIARSLIVEPELIVLDEPTSALDRSVQHQILELLKSLQKKRQLSYLFISHDLKVIRALCHRVCVMKDGQIVEHGDTDALFKAPQEAYTRTLIEAAFPKTVEA